LFGLGFHQIENVKHAYYFMGVVLSRLSCVLLTLKEHCGLLFGKDDIKRKPSMFQLRRMRRLTKIKDKLTK